MGRVPVADLTRAAPWPWMHHLSTAAALLNRRAPVAGPGTHEGCPGDLRGARHSTHRPTWMAGTLPGSRHEINCGHLTTNRQRSPGVQGRETTTVTPGDQSRLHGTQEGAISTTNLEQNRTAEEKRGFSTRSPHTSASMAGQRVWDRTSGSGSVSRRQHHWPSDH